MAEKIIQNPSITSGDFSFSGDAITAIAGHPVAGVGGGGTQSDYVYVPSFNDQTGDITFTLGVTGSEGKGPWHISGTQGPQGPSGTNGTDGKDATPITATITTAVGGTQVTISYTSGGDPLAQFTVLSGAKGADGVSPTVSLKDITDTEHSNGGTEVTITDENGAHTYSAWNGNDGSMAGAPAIAGYNGVSADLVGGTKYVVGLSGGYYSDTLSAYSAMYAGYASNAKFSDNSVSSMDQIKGSIDWGNQIASVYATHSGDYATSSSQVITGDKQYGLTTAGWAEIDIPEAGGEYLPLSGGTVSGATYFSAANGQNIVAVASAATLIGASRQTSSHFGQDSQALGTTWIGVGSTGMHRGFLKYTQGGNVGDLDTDNMMQVEFTPANKGQIFAKATNNNNVCPETQILNPTKASCDAMVQSANANLVSGPNYMLAKNADGQFVIGAACVNCTAISDVTLSANTYYFVYEV